MDERKSLILKAIIESFVQAADPVGSNYILSNYKMKISSATIRNDMAYLEDMGLIYQPHISAGRVPTAKGFRLFVDELMDSIPTSVRDKQQALLDLKRRNDFREIDMFFKEALGILSDVTQNVSFITLPWKPDAYYLGLSHVLRKPEFNDAVNASSIVEVLEEKNNFLEFVSQVDTDRKTKVYIGDENIIDGIKSCSVLVCKYEISNVYQGTIGILGSTRMRYAYNISALEFLRDDLENKCKGIYY